MNDDDRPDDGEPMDDEAIEVRDTAPRDNLIRQFDFRADPAEGDGRTLDGYGAVFNQWTEIDSWEGTFKERIAPGAFKKTLGERMPILQFNHGQDTRFGALPIGVITSAKEDKQGLHIQARLHDHADPIREAIASGAINGMSFRFRVVQDEWKKAKGAGMAERTIKEVALYEAGPVVFPAYEGTSVGVRSRDVLTALADPILRAEVLRALGTGDPAATQEPVEPQAAQHSTRTRAQRRATVALRLSLQKESA